MRNKYLNAIYLLPFFLSVSCDNCESWGETSLGNNFALVEADRDDVSIIYCTSKKCCTVGIPVVPSKVVNYKTDGRWIIAKSEAKDESLYWIIDKDFKMKFEYDKGMQNEVLSHVTGSLDSAKFYQAVRQKNISLKF